MPQDKCSYGVHSYIAQCEMFKNWTGLSIAEACLTVLRALAIIIILRYCEVVRNKAFPRCRQMFFVNSSCELDEHVYKTKFPLNNVLLTPKNVNG